MPQAPKSFQQVLAELWELLKAYAQQETIGPLKNLGRQVGLGMLGTLSFCLGYFLIVLGVMRFLQTHTKGFLIDFSVHNYLSYFVAVLMLLGGCIWAVLKAKGKSDPDANPTTPPATVASAAVNANEAGASAAVVATDPNPPAREEP